MLKLETIASLNGFNGGLKYKVNSKNKEGKAYKRFISLGIYDTAKMEINIWKYFEYIRLKLEKNGNQLVIEDIHNNKKEVLFMVVELLEKWTKVNYKNDQQKLI